MGYTYMGHVHGSVGGVGGGVERRPRAKLIFVIKTMRDYFDLPARVGVPLLTQ